MSDDRPIDPVDDALTEQLRWLRENYRAQDTNVEPETREEEQLEQRADVRVDAETKTMESQLLRKERLSNDELEKRIENQEKFLAFSLKIIGIPVVAASVGFLILVCKKDAGDATYAAFFASVVAEVIGLSYILGNYFFPNQKSDRENDSDKK